jgi:hypothetical protein
MVNNVWDLIWDYLINIAVIITILTSFGITRQKLFGWYLRIFTWTWLKKESMKMYFFVAFVSLLTLFIIWALVYFPISKGIFDGKWALLLGIMIYFLIGIWVPIIETLGFKWKYLHTFANWVATYGVIPILIGFWAISLPKDWLLPLILTIIVVAAFLGSYVYNRWKTKPKQTTKK